VLFANAVLAGIAVGSVYGLLAIGYTVIFSATGVFNLAQGDLIMCAVMLSYVMLDLAHVPQIVAFIVVIVGLPVLALIEERTVVRPFLSRGKYNIGWFISTLAFSLIVETVVTIWYGNNPPAAIPSPLPSTAVRVGGLSLTWQQLLCVFALVVVTIVLDLFYRRSWLGTAMRATAEARDIASLRGISPNRMSALAFAISGLLAGIAGFVIAPILFADPTIGLTYSVKGFIALAIGGFGSMRGAIVGGLALGIGEQLFDLYISPQFEIVAGLILLAATLTFFPRGMFGGRGVRTV
jgi:branched-chain amino acid transport system permease protein